VLLADLGLVGLVLSWHRGKGSGRPALPALALPALIAAALPWLELWYGSTFDYPNRERQSLLTNLNNGGVLGSALFLLGAVWSLPLAERWRARAFLGKLAAT
jgi:hypothetical protein